jgi:hypothetical protein
MIVILALLGLAAAAAVYFFYPPVYQSQAKLLVRYVLDRSAIDSIEGTTSSSKTTDMLIGCGGDRTKAASAAVFRSPYQGGCGYDHNSRSSSNGP